MQSPATRQGQKDRESLEDAEKIMTETKVKFKAQGQKQIHEKLTRKGQRNWMPISRHPQSKLDRSPAKPRWASLPQPRRMPPSLSSWSEGFPVWPLETEKQVRNIQSSQTVNYFKIEMHILLCDNIYLFCVRHISNFLCPSQILQITIKWTRVHRTS